MTLLPAWMIWAVALTLVLFLAGAGAERALRPLGLPVRWGWLAMALLAGGLLLAPWLPGGGGETGGRILFQGPEAASEGTIPAGKGGPSLSGLLYDPLALVAQGATRLSEALPVWSGAAAAILWGLASFATATLLISAHLRLHGRRKRWESTQIQGRPVLLSSGLGPAVVGIRNPRIVIPRGLLDLPEPEMQLILLHEESHAASRDTLTLAAGLLPAVLFPWNPGLWWMLGRLRGGVELDCDRRVLRTGVPPARYARLLLTVATRGFGEDAVSQTRMSIPATAAPALVEPTSLLERRMRNMKTLTSSSSRVSALLSRTGSLAAGLAALAMVAVACETQPPTLVEEGPAALVGAEDAPNGGATVRQEAGSRASAADQVVTDPLRSIPADAAPRPLIYVDGVRRYPDSLEGVAPEAIERIEVLKGRAAELSFGPEASGGVIQIFLKEGARRAPR